MRLNTAEGVAIFKDTTHIGNLYVGSGSLSTIKVHGSFAGASNNAYTGHYELHCASPWDLFLNLQTPYPNGGWMYFQINDASFMQLPGSDN